MDNKSISENAVGSYGIRKCCAYLLCQLAANTIRVGLVLGCAGIGVLIG